MAQFKLLIYIKNSMSLKTIPYLSDTFYGDTFFSHITKPCSYSSQRVLVRVPFVATRPGQWDKLEHTSAALYMYYSWQQEQLLPQSLFPSLGSAEPNKTLGLDYRYHHFTAAVRLINLSDMGFYSENCQKVESPE